MRTLDDLEQIMHSIDGRGYASYRQLRGSFDLDGVVLSIDHVQSDPYASPSRVQVMVPRDRADFPDDLLTSRGDHIAVGDFLTRQIAGLARRVSARSGSGNSGTVSIGHIGPEVMERTSIAITPQWVTARLEVGLPAHGRRVNGRAAFELLVNDLAELGDRCLVYSALDADALGAQVVMYRDQEYIRAQLAPRGLIAFVGNGSVLPRAAGNSAEPLDHGVLAFTSPDTLQVEMDLPSGRSITGMGIPQGVTAIVGGGYHGKSTLLRALSHGIYPHRLGDGREWVITDPKAVSVRAEDGRTVAGTDISAFIGELPSGTDTHRFWTTNASGSTSQAANLVEALDMGASTLLIDEDTSATNFMIRDARMRVLVPAEREPIVPFVERVRPLFDQRGVSTVLVAGGSSAFLDVADQTLCLDSYRVLDVSEMARELAQPFPQETGEVTGSSTTRIPRPSSLRPGSKTKPARSKGRSLVAYGREIIDLGPAEQLVDTQQTVAIAHALDQIARLADGRASLDELVHQIDDLIDAEGLEALSPYSGHPGLMARPRVFEIAAALNRYRGLTLHQD